MCTNRLPHLHGRARLGRPVAGCRGWCGALVRSLSKPASIYSLWPVEHPIGLVNPSPPPPVSGTHVTPTVGHWVLAKNAGGEINPSSLQSRWIQGADQAQEAKLHTFPPRNLKLSGKPPTMESVMATSACRTASFARFQPALSTSACMATASPSSRRTHDSKALLSSGIAAHPTGGLGRVWRKHRNTLGSAGWAATVAEGVRTERWPFLSP